MTTKTSIKRAGYTMSIVAECVTPAGQPGVIVECTCRTHAGNSGRAILTLPPSRPLNLATIHGNVTMVHDPRMAKLLTLSPHGPWKA